MTKDETKKKYCDPCREGKKVIAYGNCDTCQFGELEDYDDPVNHPSHYTAGGIECIDAITAAISCQKDPVCAWLTAQCLKYLWRWPLKNGLEDLKKTRFYLDRLIERMEDK